MKSLSLSQRINSFHRINELLAFLQIEYSINTFSTFDFSDLSLSIAKLKQFNCNIQICNEQSKVWTRLVETVQTRQEPPNPEIMSKILAGCAYSHLSGPELELQKKLFFAFLPRVQANIREFDVSTLCSILNSCLKAKISHRELVLMSENVLLDRFSEINRENYGNLCQYFHFCKHRNSELLDRIFREMLQTHLFTELQFCAVMRFIVFSPKYTKTTACVQIFKNFTNQTKDKKLFPETVGFLFAYYGFAGIPLPPHFESIISQASVALNQKDLKSKIALNILNGIRRISLRSKSCLELGLKLLNWFLNDLSSFDFKELKLIVVRTLNLRLNMNRQSSISKSYRMKYDQMIYDLFENISFVILQNCMCQIFVMANFNYSVSEESQIKIDLICRLFIACDVLRMRFPSFQVAVIEHFLPLLETLQIAHITTLIDTAIRIPKFKPEKLLKKSEKIFLARINPETELSVQEIRHIIYAFTKHNIRSTELFRRLGLLILNKKGLMSSFRVTDFTVILTAFDRIRYYPHDVFTGIALYVTNRPWKREKHLPSLCRLLKKDENLSERLHTDLNRLIAVSELETIL